MPRLLSTMRDCIPRLSIGDELGRVFDLEDIELARLFADQVSSALVNAQLYAEVQAAHERLQALSRQILEVQEAERRRIATNYTLRLANCGSRCTWP